MLSAEFSRSGATELRLYLSISQSTVLLHLGTGNSAYLRGGARIWEVMDGTRLLGSCRVLETERGGRGQEEEERGGQGALRGRRRRSGGCRPVGDPRWAQRAEGSGGSRAGCAASRGGAQVGSRWAGVAPRPRPPHPGARPGSGLAARG